MKSKVFCFLLMGRAVEPRRIIFVRLASVPLLVVIDTAIARTRIPELFRASQGFWFMLGTSGRILPYSARSYF
jgi:hypothetical protein